MNLITNGEMEEMWKSRTKQWGKERRERERKERTRNSCEVDKEKGGGKEGKENEKLNKRRRKGNKLGAGKTLLGEDPGFGLI